LTVDRVATVARVPDERVRPTAELCDIFAAAAGDGVVAAAAEQQVVAVASRDGVVAGPAVDGDLLVGESVADRDGVVAPSAADEDLGELSAVEVLHGPSVRGHAKDVRIGGTQGDVDLVAGVVDGDDEAAVGHCGGARLR
jgi:hypothetical protein